MILSRRTGADAINFSKLQNRSTVQAADQTNQLDHFKLFFLFKEDNISYYRAEPWRRGLKAGALSSVGSYITRQSGLIRFLLTALGAPATAGGGGRPFSEPVRKRTKKRKGGDCKKGWGGCEAPLLSTQTSTPGPAAPLSPPRWGRVLEDGCQRCPERPSAGSSY